MRRYAFLICALLLNVTVALGNSEGYFYRLWSTDVTVKKNNTWVVEENYDVTFTEQRHGIFRYIQNEYGVNRNMSADGEPQDIKYLRYRPEINLISGSGGDVYYNAQDENDCFMVRWGSADQMVFGPQSYGMVYTYQTPDDRVEARDYVFHSLLPADVRTDIEEFRFTINFEKPLPARFKETLKFYSGKFGGIETIMPSNLTVTDYQVSGVVRNVKAGHALTIFAELPQGYYEDTLQPDSGLTWTFYFISILLALLLLYYEIFGKTATVTPSVEFYAPDGITPTLVGKIIDGTTDNIDIAALIPWLAEKGYITIKEYEEKGFLKKKTEVELTKVKDLPDDAPRYQKDIMHLLFSDGDTVVMSEMGDRHNSVQDAKTAVDNIFVGDKQLTTRKHVVGMLALVLSSTICLLTSSPICLFYDNHVVGGIIWLITFAVACAIRYAMAERDMFEERWARATFTIGRWLIFAIVMFVIHWFMIDGFDNILSLAQIGILVVLCFAVCELSGNNVHNTPYRTEIAGKLLGFRNFINTAEKDRLKMLVDQDPSYFYKVLPYAMVFGLTDKWTKIFEDIKIEPATWYTSSSLFNGAQFGRNIDRLSSSISKAIETTAVDHTQSSSSGDFSGGGGGGFSGGGGGGGGAGSW